MRIGVLALQGAFELHKELIQDVLIKRKSSFEIIEVRKVNQLEGLDGLILPGGESTSMLKLITGTDLDEELHKFVCSDKPLLATCAGTILLANHFGALDCQIKRNAFGSQRDSFEAEINLTENDKKLRVSFIRAPRITKVGTNVKILATLSNEPVAVAQRNIIAMTCHVELEKEPYFHEIFVSNIAARVASLTS